MIRLGGTAPDWNDFYAKINKSSLYWRAAKFKLNGEKVCANREGWNPPLMGELKFNWVISLLLNLMLMLRSC